MEGDARLEFIRDGKKCKMKFLDADVKRPLASVSISARETSSCSDRGNRTSRTRALAREDSNEHEDRRVCGAVGRPNGFENDERCEIRRATNERTRAFRRPALSDLNRERSKKGSMSDEHRGRGRCRTRVVRGTEESNRRRKSLEKGRLRENTILDNQANKKEVTAHLPFRSWCRRCIKGRGARRTVAEQLRKRDTSLRHPFGLHVHGRRKGSGETMAMLVARERATRVVLSTVVPKKSTGDSKADDMAS